VSERRVLAFVGNRHATLSRAFFHGLAQRRSAASFELLLVDSSTAAQTAGRARARRRTVAALKRWLGAAVPTSAIDWFRDPAARAFPQITPPRHDLGAAPLARELEARAVQAMFVAGCDQILREPLVSRVPRIVNFHNGLLPEYRGVRTVEWAFLNREAVAGYTFHTIESASIDRGRVVLRRELPIRPDDTPASFDRRLVDDAVAHLDVVLRALLVDAAWPPGAPVVDGGAYYSAKRMRQVRRFDPAQPVAETLHRFAVLCNLDLPSGRVPLKITALEPVSEQPGLPQVTGHWRRYGRGIVVRCVDGWLRIAAIDYVPAALAAWLLPRAI
jgi:methionyl-tRNA formyltransferase